MPVDVPEGFETLTRYIRRVRRVPYVSADGKVLFHQRLRVDLEMGVGTTSGQGEDPVLLMRYSDDGGHTWSNERPAHIGKIGQYKARAEWHQLGKSRQRIYEFVLTDPVKAVLIDADLKVAPGLH